MLTRRGFAARLGMAAAATWLMPEMALAQRAAINLTDLNLTDLPKDVVWLNANENPAGPPDVSLAAMRKVLPTSGRYHYQEFRDIYAAIARSEDLAPDQIVIGSGSSEVLHTSVDVFTSPTSPLISVAPAYEMPIELARTLGRPVVLTKLREDYTTDVHKLAEEAEKAGGGLIYVCNPNNPTSAITTAKEIDWLMSNLPANTTLLVDEAYIQFGDTPDLKTALPYVRQGKDVIVTRTYSKIYGMAGLRVGFAAAKPAIIQRLRQLQIHVVSIVGARAVTAALQEQNRILTERKATLAKTRRDLCNWMRDSKVKFIEPHANFVMIDCGRSAREFIMKMPTLGVVPGRPFPPLENMLRVTIGTDSEMAKFREVFWKLYKA